MLIHRFTCFWLAVLVLVPASGCGQRQPFTPLPPGASVLAFGDSITEGVGAAPGEDYPARLAAGTGWEVINAGVSGDTAREARKRLAPLLSMHKPALVILELGGNDFLRQAPAGQVKSHLVALIREARDSGALVALVAVPRLSLLRASVGALADSPIYAELAEKEGAILVPDTLSRILSDDELRADEIHSNAPGYAQLAEGIALVLSDVGLLPAGR